MRNVFRKIEEAWQGDALEALAEFVRLPAKSPDFDPDWEQNGVLLRALEDAARWAKVRFPEGTFEILSAPGVTPVLWVDIPGTPPGRPALFYGHFDKQPEAGEWSEGLAPFEPVLRDGRLYGRGTADDGYSFYAALTAARAMDEAGRKRPRIMGVFETREESGSGDLPHYLPELSKRAGRPSVLTVLDLGIQDKTRLWRTQSLRGVVTFTLKVEVLASGVHSGVTSGIVPSSFAVMRTLLDRLEDPATGRVKVASMHVPEPTRHMPALRRLAELSGEDLWKRFPWAGETEPRSFDPLELLLKNGWQPTLSILGAEGLPPVKEAGALIRPSTTLKLSFRIPPGVDAQKAAEDAVALVTTNVPSKAKVTVANLHAEPGFEAPAGAEWLDAAWSKASEELFRETAEDVFDGATIGILPKFVKAFGPCPFLCTGVLGTEDNAHAPDESVSLEYLTKLTCAVASVLDAVPEEE